LALWRWWQKKNAAQYLARTKAALQAAKVRGVKLGGHRTDAKGKPVSLSRENIAKGREAIARRADAKAADIAPAIRELQKSGATSLRDIATGLNSAGIPTPRGRHGRPFRSNVHWIV
jgi:hypothetical protein